jgi:hypothetical protein
MSCLGGVETGVNQEKGASKSRDRKTKNRRQGKPREGEASGAVMFGSDGHIGFSPSNRLLALLIRAFLKSTNCSFRMEFSKAH